MSTRPAARLASVLVLVLSQYVGAQDLAAGKLLVASREVTDATFAQSVVLLIRHDRSASMGLVLNRPSNIPLSDALEGLEQAGGGDEPAYIGGPVGRSGALALLRSSNPPAKTTRVMDGLFLISSREQLAEALEAGKASESLRVYVGYAGWRASRLEAEVAQRFWHVTEGSAEAAFDPYPASLWRRLIAAAEPKLAQAGLTAGGTRGVFLPPSGPR